MILTTASIDVNLPGTVLHGRNCRGLEPRGAYMAAGRPIWSGFIRFGLVSVPVQAYSASTPTGEGGEISLNQLHGECHSRIQYKKTCPIHGEVPNVQIVKGY